MIPDQNILTEMMKSLQYVLKSGATNLYPDATKLLYTLIVIDLAVAYIMSLINEEDAGYKLLLERLLKYGFFIFMVTIITDKTGFAIIVNAIGKSFVFIGIKAANSGLTEDLFTNPSQIAQHGMDIAWNMISAPKDFNFESGIMAQLIICMSGIGVILSFFYIAIQIFYVSIQFAIVAAAGLILVPFGVWDKTKFIFVKIKNAILYIGYKYMFLTFIVAITYNIIKEWEQVPASVTYQQSLYILFASTTLAILCKVATNMASMHGMLTLGAMVMAARSGAIKLANVNPKVQALNALRKGAAKNINKGANTVANKLNFPRK